MKKLFLLMFIMGLLVRPLLAGEGMWIPMLLQQLNEKEMKDMGMRISAEDIYSINHSSLKDAIVLFGGGCTAEIVSDKGLILTNHHCGFGEIQRHSSVEHDYLTYGFWAMSQADELPCPGLTTTMLMKMEEVTNAVLDKVTADMTEQQRNALIKENSSRIIEKAAKESGYDAVVRSFYQGNQYYLLYTQTFKDVRLVGAPPSNIGKFGGDTDNWMWPRHTGDFSVFRIYVGKDGKPADFSTDNVPYKPASHIPVSLRGVEENDFTFVFGYPARTKQYLPSYGVSLITEVTNPPKITLRETRLEIFKRHSLNNPRVRIQYAAKDARIANGWKKMIGESKGIDRLNGIARKQQTEARFMDWAASDANKAYAGLLPAFEARYAQLIPIALAADYINEAGMGIELVGFAARFRPLVDESMKASADAQKMTALTESLRKQTDDYFKDYYEPIDREVAAALLKLYAENQPSALRPAFLDVIQADYKGNYTAYVDKLFAQSVFTTKESVQKLLENVTMKTVKKITSDPAYKLYTELFDFYNQHIKQPYQQLNDGIDSLQRLYMQGLMAMQTDTRFYPDANFTLRVTYGKVEGYAPADGVYYTHFTTLDGIMEKENPDVYDYVVEDKLKNLYNTRDYGRYAASDGKMHVAFAASNHTTGGNSGSPVLNADGQMIGLNFDRCWEGTMSDLMYDPAMSRNIAVDIRYILFIMDKYAGARHLVDEMTLVN